MALGVPTARAPSAANKFGKVPLTQGHSALDWARLAGRGPAATPRGRVSQQDLRQHCTREDLWIVVNGRVYDVTEYADFHPGGVQALMEAAGQDATELFMEYHPWVNYDVLLQRFFVGLYLG